MQWVCSFLNEKRRVGVTRLFVLAAALFLRTDEFYRSLTDLEGPFVWIVDTSGAAGIEPSLRVVAPCPQVIAALHQVADHNVIILAEGIASIPALSVAGCFIQVE